MQIKELLTKNKKVFSFEFFPPKDAEGEKQLYHTIDDLRPLNPSFVSVTYGALGTNQDHTLALVRTIKQELHMNVMAHFTCIGAAEAKVDFFLRELQYAGIENILALRGDVPEGISPDVAFHGSYCHAVDLVKAIRAKMRTCTIAVAGYPQGHPEAATLDSDVDALKKKVDAGADFVVTQFFFENETYYRFCDLARKKGITVPIIPGIMPIQNMKQIEIFAKKCGVTIPRVICDFYFHHSRTDEERRSFGIDYATKQCQDLLHHGVLGIHFYTLNRSNATRIIYQNIALAKS